MHSLDISLLNITWQLVFIKGSMLPSSPANDFDESPRDRPTPMAQIHGYAEDFCSDL